MRGKCGKVESACPAIQNTTFNAWIKSDNKVETTYFMCGKVRIAFHIKEKIQ